MEKNILVISTSLRKGSNSELLAGKFAIGAKEAGHRVEKISLRDKKIAFCRGCLACQHTGKCVLKDDGNEIADKMLAAADEEEHTVEAAVKGLSGWISCFPKSALAGTVFAGGVDKIGEIEGHLALEKAYQAGREV